MILIASAATLGIAALFYAAALVFGPGAFPVVLVGLLVGIGGAVALHALVGLPFLLAECVPLVTIALAQGSGEMIDKDRKILVQTARPAVLLVLGLAIAALLFTEFGGPIPSVVFVVLGGLALIGGLMEWRRAIRAQTDHDLKEKKRRENERQRREEERQRREEAAVAAKRSEEEEERKRKEYEEAARTRQLQREQKLIESKIAAEQEEAARQARARARALDARRERERREALKHEAKNRARQRGADVSWSEANRHELQFLERVWAVAYREVDNPVWLTEVVRPDEDIADLWFIGGVVSARGWVVMSEPDKESWQDTVRLTRDGFERLDAAHRDNVEERMVREVYNVSGDYISAGEKSTVVNRSKLDHSLNRVKISHGQDVMEALETVSKEVEKSDNPDAAELFDVFKDELAADSPRPSVLRNTFEGVLTAAPAISQYADVVSKVSQLFT